MLDETEHIVKLSFDNYSRKEKYLNVEPWGAMYKIPAQDALVLVAQGPKSGFPGVGVANDCIEYYGWNGSAYEIYHENQLISSPMSTCIRC